VSKGVFTDAELDYLASALVDTLFTRIRKFIEQVEVAVDEKAQRERDSGTAGS